MMVSQLLVRCVTFLSILALVICQLSVLSLHAHADGHSVHHVDKKVTTRTMASSANVEGQWARATFALAKAGAAYFTLTNTGNTVISLTGASVDDSIAAMTQLHHTIMLEGMMRMQELKNGIEIGPGATMSLAPGGTHLMVMGLEKPFNKGESVDFTLYFEDGSQLSKRFPVLDKRY